MFNNNFLGQKIYIYFFWAQEQAASYEAYHDCHRNICSLLAAHSGQSEFKVISARNREDVADLCVLNPLKQWTTFLDRYC